MVNAATVGLITALHGTNDGAPTDLNGIVNVINKKVDKSYVDTELDKKANTSDVDTKLSEKTDVNIFTQLKEKVNAISIHQNILTGNVSGSEITTTDSFAAPFVGLRVFGKSTQDGTPLPNAPVPIVSAGDGGTVTVTVSDGANESQTLTLQTPNALPGIPVTSGGNYTDENGQQWVCDEVDLARGVRVQRITKFKLTSSMSWTKTGNNVDRYFCTFYGIDAAGTFCTHFSAAINRETVGGIATGNGTAIGFAYAEKGTTTVDDFKAFLDANEVYVWTSLATPIKTALSAAEIAAYKALTTYAPTTVISASGSAEMIALYQRDANTVAKINEDALKRLETDISEVGKYADLKEKVDALQTSGASTAEVADTNAVSIHGADGVYDLSKGTIQARLNELETGEGLKVEKSTLKSLRIIGEKKFTMGSLTLEPHSIYCSVNSEQISMGAYQQDYFIVVRPEKIAQSSDGVLIFFSIIYDGGNFVVGNLVFVNPTDKTLKTNQIENGRIYVIAPSETSVVTNVSGKVISGGSGYVRKSYVDSQYAALDAKITSSTKIANGTGMAQVGTGKELVVDYSATGFTSAPVVVASHCQIGESDTDTSGVVKVLSVTKTGCKISIIGGTPDHDYPVSWIATGT